MEISNIMHVLHACIQSTVKVEAVWEGIIQTAMKKKEKIYRRIADQPSVFIQRSGIKRFLSLRDFIYIVIYIKVMWYVDIVMF